MTVSEKIKIIDDKIEQNKAQYSLDKQTAKILAFSSGNIGKFCIFNRWRYFTRKRTDRKKLLQSKDSNINH